MHTTYDFENKTFEMEQTYMDEDVYTNDEYRLENYTYGDSHGKDLLYVSKVYNKNSNKLESCLFEPTEKYMRNTYEKIKDNPLLTYKYSDDVLFEYAPALVYKANDIRKGISHKEKIFLVENERLANYLTDNGFLATTVYNPSCTKKINLQIFKKANVYIIKFKSFINYEKELKNIANSVITLNDWKDYQDEFGQDCKLQNIIKEYAKYESDLKNVDLLYDEAFYNHFIYINKIDKED